MKNVTVLTKSFENFINNLVETIVEEEKQTCSLILDDAKRRIEIPQEARNTSQFIRYEQSLQISEAKIEKNEIKTSVFSDYCIEGTGSKWDGVPVGAFLEWGTGPLGEGSNSYEHGFKYTTNGPWDLHTAIQWVETGTWGIRARPHLYPSLQANKINFEERIKEAINQAWKK